MLITFHFFKIGRGIYLKYRYVTKKHPVYIRTNNRE